MTRYKFLILLGAATLAVAGAFGACSSHGGGNVALNTGTGPSATTSISSLRMRIRMRSTTIPLPR